MNFRVDQCPEPCITCRARGCFVFYDLILFLDIVFTISCVPATAAREVRVGMAGHGLTISQSWRRIRRVYRPRKRTVHLCAGFRSLQAPSRLSPTQRTMATDDNAGIAKTKSVGYRFRLVNLHGGGIGNESVMNDLNPE